MPVKKVNQSIVISAAYGSFRKYGYHATSMADIAKTSGILKGSLYHYFKSKEELLMAVLNAQHVRNSLGELKVAYYEKLDGNLRLKMLLNSINDEIFINDGGCILGNMSLELSNSFPEAMMLIEQIFTEWIEAMSHIYEQRFDEITAMNKAQNALKELQGGIMLSRVYGDSGYLSDSKEIILKMIV